jgi:hypothetical protein
MQEQQRVPQQTTIRLPHFDEEVPALITEDEKLYIPVIAICRMLWIRADTHIRRWRRMLLWEDARKLPLCTPRGTRIVWCLSLGSLPFLYGYCNWKEVSPLRRAQLRQATEEAMEVVGRAYKDMQQTYRHTRQALYRFLVAFAPLESTLQRKAELLSPRLDQESRLQFEALVDLGCTLIAEATRQASAIVQWQAAQPIMEVFTVDADGSALALVHHGNERLIAS